jgi:hypothetical protein
MKKILFSLILMLAITLGKAQVPIDRVVDRMLLTPPNNDLYYVGMIEMFKKCEVEKENSWQKDYYTALACLQLANTTSNRDTLKNLLAEASRYLEFANKLISSMPNANFIKSEIKCLKILSLAIELKQKEKENPIQISEMRNIDVTLDDARKDNEKNPRIDFAKAVSLMNKVSATKEDKILAKTLLEKVVTTLTAQAKMSKNTEGEKVASAGQINWGLLESHYLLEKFK